MSIITSSLSQVQEKQLLSLLGHVRLHLLFKGTIHGFTAAAFHSRCDKQGPTVIAAYNPAGIVFGAYTSMDYTQSGQDVDDDEAFLYSISPNGNEILNVAGISNKPAFTDGNDGPNYGALVFLHDNTPAIESKPGTNFQFVPKAMHGDDLTLVEFEVYRVERE